MIDFELIDRAAKSAFGNYSMFTEALRSVILNFILNSGQPSPLTKRLAEESLAGYAASVLQNISETAQQATISIGLSEAQRSAGAKGSEAVGELNSSAVVEIAEALRIQVQRDVAVAKGYISRAALVGQSVHTVAIKTKDRAGRSWDSSLLIQKLIRGHLLSHGADAYVVARLSPERNDRFSFTNEAGDLEPFGVEDYFDVKAEILHPNARWWVV